MIIKPPTKIILKESPVHGLGVFCNERILKKEFIEICPFLLFPQTNSEQIPVFSNYSFCWPRSENWTNHALVLGYGSFYNHSEKANANWYTDGQSYIFFATEDIEQGQEIFINYANGIKFE